MSFFKVDRKIVEWEWFGNGDMLKLWIYILAKVNYTDKSWQGIEIPRGSFITSISSLAEGTGLTTQKIRTILKKFEKSGEISQKSTNKYTQINVIKWEQYQYCDEDSNKQITNKQQTNNKQITTTKEIIERKEIKNIIIAPSSKEHEAGARYLIPLISNTGKEIFRYRVVFQNEIDEWQQIYQGIDVDLEIRKIASWSKENGSRRKSPSGVDRFIVSWLARSQDRASSSAPVAKKSGEMYDDSQNPVFS